MEYVALYRKYRPKTFDGVYGQEHIVQTLKNQIANDKVGHAYLFCGTRGTGKTSVAKIFARAINCKDNKDGNPCLQCDNCRLSDSANVDVVEMDAASNTGVDYARDLREKVQYAPVCSRYKVYIIDEVHMLSTSAFNALLKTLEEPPQHVVFILCTTEVYKLPATILSRCMRFDFKLLSVSILSELLNEVFAAEGKKASAEAVNAIAVAAEGSARDCLSIADRCASSEDELTYDKVTSILGVSSRTAIINLADALIEGDTAKTLSSIYSLNAEGKDLGLLAKDLTKHFSDLLLIKTCKEAEKILVLPKDVFQKLSLSAQNATQQKLIYALNVLQKLDSQLRYSQSPFTLFCANALIVATSSGEVDAQSLERRISRLEQMPQNVAADTTLVVDKTNAVSIWKAVKKEIDKLNLPLLKGVWTEVSPRLAGDDFVIDARQSCFDLLGGEYKDIVLSIVKRIVDKNFKLNLLGASDSGEEAKLKALGNNVKIN